MVKEATRVISKHEDFVLYVLFAVDVAGENERIIATYRPNPEEWEVDLKTRRRLP
jgi:hypothetical protein